MRVTAVGDSLAGTGIESAGGGPSIAVARGGDLCPNCNADLAASRVVVDSAVWICDGCLRELPPNDIGPAARTIAVVQATWNGAVLARSTNTRHIDGAVYFPPADVVRDYLSESTRTSVCLSNGRAHFLHLTVGSQQTPDAAWHWPPPSPLSRHLPGHIAFGQDVVISEHRGR